MWVLFIYFENRWFSHTLSQQYIKLIRWMDRQTDKWIDGWVEEEKKGCIES